MALDVDLPEQLLSLLEINDGLFVLLLLKQGRAALKDLLGDHLIAGILHRKVNSGEGS